ncbi:MAG: 3-deoxy-D-manno-octulosonic acid transferase [Acidobacteriia bacterium]|nr:3-deoxy-D-manno-octulosonic acid transferase [Terriglobia bacterium]
MLFLFQILFIIFSVLMLPWYLTKVFRTSNVARRFWERFGFYSAEVRRQAAGGNYLWVEACSVGETRVALLLIEQLHRRWPDSQIALTTTTSTGRALALKSVPAGVLVLYFPVDFYLCTRRAMRLLRPRMLLIVERDIWPTLVLTARRYGVPVGIVNGRMSQKSFCTYHRLGVLSRSIYRSFDLVCAQGPQDAERHYQLGVHQDALRVTGSMKFDEAQKPAANSEQALRFLHACGADASRPIWVCGSTHWGEEEIVFRVLRRLRTKFPELFLVVAPRHPERAKQVLALAHRRGLNVALRTEPPRRGADCVLLNTTGELKAFYEAATLIFVGKSLRGRGGQNIIEAAAAGAPVLFGPRMQNFEAVAEAFVRAGGAVQVRDENELSMALEELLAGPDRRREIAEHARQVIVQSSGATQRTVDAIAEILECGEPDNLIPGLRSLRSVPPTPRSSCIRLT